MSDRGEPRQFPVAYSGAVGTGDPGVPLYNLSTVRSRMDSLQQFLSKSVNSKTLLSKDQMEMVSTEISAAIHQIIVNGAALLASSQPLYPLPAAVAKIPEMPSDPPDLLKINKTAPPTPKRESAVKPEEADDAADGECDIVEMDAVELLAEHVHFCEICGKGFKRDANLRMHMRAHGNQFKTLEALAKPLPENQELLAAESSRKRRFSCPYEGCNRNRKHKKFRPLKSVICVRNHFKRSHCPKMYSCNRCNKKSFSVVADLKSHLKHCGESRWKCSCGTSFSRKDKLFGHMALFEGHMPAVVGGGREEEEEEEKVVKGVEAAAEEGEEEEEEEEVVKQEGLGGKLIDNAFFEGLLDGFGSIEGYSLQGILESPRNAWSNMEEF